MAQARSIVADKEISEDIVQDCLLKLWSIRETLDDYSSPEALAMTIVHRLALNELRNRKPNVEISEELFAGFEPSPEEKLLDIELEDNVRRIMSQLPERHQALIRMRHIEGLSNAEIANILSSPEGAVRTALSRARNRVAELFLKSQSNSPKHI